MHIRPNSQIIATGLFSALIGSACVGNDNAGRPMATGGSTSAVGGQTAGGATCGDWREEKMRIWTRHCSLGSRAQ